MVYILRIFFFILCCIQLPGLNATQITWQGWSDDHFTQAKKEQRLILLDLEAVWCHWCHVMAEKTYSNPEIIQLINTHFIAVKVDQDSRPELSNHYQDYGWPATIIFNAKGQELAKLAGYIPPEEMKNILQNAIKNPSKIIQSTTSNEYSKDPYLSKNERDKLNKTHLFLYDDKNKGWGGFNNGQKFMDPDVVEYALVQAESGDNTAARMARETLNAQMALLDPIWGGMYQYSVGGDWKQPHFEKIMSYQAEDLRVYALAYNLWHEPRYLQTAKRINEFLNNFLLSPEGAFYTSQNADVIDGQHSAEYFKLNDEERRKQGIPRVDTHIYARENGWAINALGFLYMATNDTQYLNQATRAAQWIINHRSISQGGFSHDEKDAAGPYLGDTLAMGRAFLTLYQATADRNYLKRAQQAAQFIKAHFKAPQGQPGFITSVPKGVRVTNHAELDRGENVMLLRFLNLLSHYTGNQEDKLMAQEVMRYLATPAVAQNGYPAPILLADEEINQSPLHVTIVGPKNDPLAKQLFQTAQRYPSSYKRIEWWDKREGNLPHQDVTYPSLDKSAAFVCTNSRCSLPVFNAQDLPKLIAQLTHFKTETSDKFTSTDTMPQDKVSQLLATSNWSLIILGFLGFGLLLSFTPCVLPMVPILASIIVGQSKNLSVKRAFALSLTYVLAMAITYAIAGVIAGLAGSYVQAYLQNPWVVGLFSLLFIVLALSLLGAYELRMPVFLAQRFASMSHQQMRGTYTGVAIMGCLATLIASPCVTAPLVGVLSYIGQSGDPWLGAVALFVMGIGMGIPLLIVGTLGGGMLPKAGNWLRGVNVFFGLVLLGVAVWFLERVVSDFVSMLLWAILAVIVSVYLGVFDKPSSRIAQIAKGLGIIILLYAGALVIGAMMGNTDYLKPLKRTTNVVSETSQNDANWKVVHNLSQFNQAMNAASHKPVILDFYAQWCISCKEMNNNVFSNPQVQELLSRFVLIRADVTQNTADELALAQHFKVIAPPAFLFFDKNGTLKPTRIDGEQNVAEFSATLNTMLSQ